MARLCARLVLALLVLTTYLVVTDVVVAALASAAPAPCGTNDNQWTNANRLTEKAGRCINGFKHVTRRRLADSAACLQRPLVQGDVYTRKNDCNNGIEAIGQARAVKFLSDRLETPSQGLISPNVQWEVTLGTKVRPDIIVYNRFSAPKAGVYLVSGVHIIEAKVTSNPKFTEWMTQVPNAVTFLTTEGMANVHAGTILNDLSAPAAYTDTFKVWEEDKGGCKLANGDAGFALNTYVATQPNPGLLSIDEKVAQRECAENKPNNSGPDLQSSVADNGDATVSAPAATEPQRTSRPTGLACLGGPSVALVAPPARVTAGTLATEGAGELAVEGGTILAAEASVDLVAAAGGPVTFVGAVVATVVISKALECYASIHGDPHLFTVDGLSYDLQSVGEFTLADSDRYGVHVQARLAPSPTPDISYLDRVALELGDSRVEFTGSTMSVDGVTTTLAAGHALSFGERRHILRDSNGAYDVLFDGLDGAFLSWNNGSLRLYVPPAANSDLIGLLGNADRNPSNDLRLANGTQLPANAAPATLHSDFADSWRIDDAESLFTYGAGESTATFTDVTFPHNIRTVHDLTPDQVATASAQCQAANVPAGPAFSGCVLDLALTADTRFATAAAAVRDVTLDPNAAGLDVTGRLRTDFEGSSLPNNTRPTRVSTDVATTSFAGAFSGADSYRFYVQSLPTHTGGTLSFDLLALGDWTAGTDVKKVMVATDRVTTSTVTPNTLTPVRSGVLASGVPFKVYRITVPFTHTASQAEFTISASGVTGLANQAFGVDNVDLQMTLVPAQHFTGTLPLTVSSGVPAAGAGNIETAVSVDDYTFTLAASGGVFVDLVTCAQSNLNWSLLDSSGKEVGYGYSCQDGEARNLAAGTYKLVARSQNSTATGAYSLTVKAIAADTTYPITLGGAAVTAATTSAGQQAVISFAATAGQKVTLQLTGGTYSSAWLDLLRPDGSKISTWFCATSCLVDGVTLPVAGTYKAVIDPSGTATGSISVRGFSVPADPAYSITLGGAAVTAATTVPGQNAAVSFAATAGQRVSVNLTGGTFNGTAWAYLYAPDGTQLYSWPCTTSCFIDPTTMPAAGTYKVLVNPDNAATGSISVRGYSVPADAAYSMTLGGAAVTAVNTVPGQNAAVSFTATAAQRASVNLTGGTFTGTAWAYVYKPDGTQLYSWPCTTSCFIDTLTLPVAGTYKVLVNPDNAATGSISVRGYSVPADTAYSINLGGAAVTAATTTPGQNAAVSFTATAGQKVSLQLNGGVFGGGQAFANLIKPDGTQLWSLFCSPSCFFDAMTLPVAGTYKVVVDPNNEATGSISVRGWSTPADTAYTMTVGGAAVTATTTVPGQNAAVSFAGTAGQKVTVQLTGGTFSSNTARLYRPDGTQITATSCATSCSFTATSLATTGTYKVVIDPDDAAVGKISVKTVTVP